MMDQSWTGWSSALVFAAFSTIPFVKEHFPYPIRTFFMKLWDRIVEIFYPYIDIRIDELSGEWLHHSRAYELIETYLTDYATKRAKKLKARMDNDENNLILSMREYEEVVDYFQGIKVWWGSYQTLNKSQSISWYPKPDEKRFYALTFHKRHRHLISTAYLRYVLKEAKEIEVRNRERKLYTNCSAKDQNRSGYFVDQLWSHVRFEHPATFETLAMSLKKKKEILNDLDFFRKAKEYYKKVGKPWKRGYLLYGPPGTGKSTLIAAMANYLDYDVYDLELTAVTNNTELRKLMIDTTSKSIIVIEDIDCTIDLSRDRNKNIKSDQDREKELEKNTKQSLDDRENKVTLSGLLNIIDGLWSSCGGERVIVFTTNHVEKLDPALIRTGRMDKHVEMSFCCFEGFKVLAKNYLDLESHSLFDQVRELIGQVKVSPADVAEKLLLGTNINNIDHGHGDEDDHDRDDDDDKSLCLVKLIEFMKNARELEKLSEVKSGEEIH